MTNQMPSALSDHFANLFDQMQRSLSGPPDDLTRALQELPSVESLPTPWETWLFCALIEHRQRQDRGRQLLLEHLPHAVPPCVDYCQRDQPVEGYLPGLPKWKVSIECTEPQYAWLISRDTGEAVTVDIGRKATHPIVKDWFLGSVRTTSPWEACARILKLTPQIQKGLAYVESDAIKGLVSEGLAKGIYYRPSDEDCDLWPEAHRLTDKAMCYADLVLGYCRAWAEPQNRLWASASIGDWFLAHELAVETGNTDLIRITAERREQCRQRRLSQLREEIGDGAAGPLQLQALAGMGAPDLDDYVERGLTGGARSREFTLNFISNSGDAHWCPQVIQLLSAAGSHDFSSSLLASATYLLDHAYRTDDVLNLVAQRHQRPDEAAVLALEYAPRRAPALARAALRFPFPTVLQCSGVEDWYQSTRQMCNVAENMALALAAINMDWTHKELANALAELRPELPTDRIRAVPLVVAIHGSRSREKGSAELWLPLLDRRALRDYSQACRERIQPMSQRLREFVYHIPLDVEKVSREESDEYEYEVALDG